MSRARSRTRGTANGGGGRRPRHNPITAVGLVSVLSPGGSSRYFRLTWTDPITGRPGGTTAGRNLEAAQRKAVKINRELQALRAGVGDKDTVGSLRTAYLADRRGRGHKGTDLTASRMVDLGRHLDRATAGHEAVRLLALDRERVDRMRAQAGTAATVRENTTALRLLLRWGARNGRLDAVTGELLASSAVTVEPIGPVRAASSAPKRRHSARKAGSSPLFVEDAPPLPLVCALHDQFQLLQPRWGALSVELAGGCGFRWGEQFQMTAYDVIETDEGVEMRVEWQIDAKAKAGAVCRRKLPKGEKTRITTVPAHSQTGYALAKEVLARRDAALAEQAAGTNPEALMFPTPTGRLYIHTSFAKNVFKPAAITAGWPFQEWEVQEAVTRKDGSVEQVLRHRLQFDLTWHSLRHRYARFAIDVLRLDEGELTVQGGWEDVEIVRKRYYKSGEEHRESSRRKVHGAGSEPSEVASAAPSLSASTVQAPTPPRSDEPTGATRSRLDDDRLALITALRTGAITLEVYELLTSDLNRLEERGSVPVG